MTSEPDPIAFERLLQSLEPKAASGGDRFRRFRSKMIKFFSWRSCEDPDNLADETTSRLLKNILAGQEISPEHPYSYVYAIATNVFLEYLRAQKKSGIRAEVDELREHPIPEAAETCHTSCLAQLSPDKREFLEHYYLDSVDRDELARENGQTVNALRLTVFRYKTALKNCIENCLKQLNVREINLS